MPPTLRLHLQDDECFAAEAVVLAVRGDPVAFDRTSCYPGGGGQRPDAGEARLEDTAALVVAIEGHGAQACDRTHVHSAREVGRLCVYRIENMGRINRRLYLRLAPPGETAA